MATEVFGKGAGEYGLLGSVMAIGSLTAALRTAGRKEPRLWIMLAALGGFVLASGAAALASTYAAFAVLLVPVGFTALTAMTVANTLVQTRVDPVMRGRVMALYMAIFMGGTPIGAPLIGWIGEVAGPRWTILVGTFAMAMTLVVVARRLLSEENVRVTWATDARPHLIIRTSPREPQLEESMPEVAR
jgi:MFS family permease